MFLPEVFADRFPDRVGNILFGMVHRQRNTAEISPVRFGQREYGF
jgi:hypothetical protein